MSDNVLSLLANAALAGPAEFGEVIDRQVIDCPQNFEPFTGLAWSFGLGLADPVLSEDGMRTSIVEIARARQASLQQPKNEAAQRFRDLLLGLGSARYALGRRGVARDFRRSGVEKTRDVSILYDPQNTHIRDKRIGHVGGLGNEDHMVARLSDGPLLRLNDEYVQKRLPQLGIEPSTDPRRFIWQLWEKAQDSENRMEALSMWLASKSQGPVIDSVNVLFGRAFNDRDPDVRVECRQAFGAVLANEGTIEYPLFGYISKIRDVFLNGAQITAEERWGWINIYGGLLAKFGDEIWNGSSQDRKSLAEAAHGLLDIARQESLDDHSRKLAYDYALWAVEAFDRVNGARIMYEWTRWQAEVEKNLGLAMHYVTTYLLPVYRDLERGDFIPPTPQQRNVAYSLLQRPDIQPGARMNIWECMSRNQNPIMALWLGARRFSSEMRRRRGKKRS